MSIWHLVILVVVAVVVFGTGKLSSIGPDLGSAIRGFKKNLNGEEDRDPKAENKLTSEASSSESRVRQDARERVSKP